MTTEFTIEDARGAHRVQRETFPLAIGGSWADIELPGYHAPEPVGYLGYSGEELFVQPGRAGAGVTCNGALVTTSQWLRHGDVLAFTKARIVVEMTAEHVRFRVEEKQEEDKTDPPMVVPTVPPSTEKSDGAGQVVKPVAFEPAQLSLKGGSRRIHPATIIFWLALPLLGLAAWLVFTLRSVELVIEPRAERVEIDGGLFVFELGGRYLLRAGDYRVVAEKEGYRRLESPIEITDERSQTFQFNLERLPGLLTVTTDPLEGAVVIVDGEEVGVTPLESMELEPGEHEVTLRADRHEGFSTKVQIEGGGLVETLAVKLEPRWAPIAFSSEPSGATVRVGGKDVGSTPVTANILEGGHAYEVILAGHKPYRSRFVVKAGEAKSLPLVSLSPADGNLVLTSEPSGANVTVDGTYRGQTPLDVFLSPGEMHEIDISEAGYESQTHEVIIRSGSSKTLAVDLVAKLGVVEIVVDPPDATLFVNGGSRGRASQVMRLTAVPQQIEIKKEGYLPYTTTITPRPGFPQSIEVVLKTEEEAKAEATPDLIQTSQGHELRLIGPRRFRMGASRREPGRRANEAEREVEITRRYYLSTQEVTNQQFREFNGKHRSGIVGGYNLELDHHPAVNMTWEEAARYCNWLSAKESLPPAYVDQGGTLVATAPQSIGYRLPTEAEWAGAARYPDGENPLKYPWGGSLPVAPDSDNYADVSANGLVPTILESYDDSFPVTAPAGSFVPNPLGLYNLGGNVAEWVQDRYSLYPPGTELEKDPMGPSEGKFHVIRGASWMHGNVTRLRFAYRDYGAKPRQDVGFRIARSVE